VLPFISGFFIERILQKTAVITLGCSTVQDRQILVDQGNNEILDITINNGFPLSHHISIEHIIYRPVYTDSASFKIANLL
jgi:hypothetical protein